MTTVDSFSYGKKGKRLSQHDATVKRIKTWHHKTVMAKVIELNVDWSQFKTDAELFDALATAMLAKAEGSRAR
jgi:hypothetical protein